MELKTYIAKGIEATGTLAALAREIGVMRESLSAANAGKRGLPLVACGKLADLIGAERWDVAVASEVLTEKDEAKRAYLLPFVLENAANVMTKTARRASNSILKHFIFRPAQQLLALARFVQGVRNAPSF